MLANKGTSFAKKVVYTKLITTYPMLTKTLILNLFER